MQTKIRFQEKVDPLFNLPREKSVYTLGYEDLYVPEAKIITTERWIACEILRHNYIDKTWDLKVLFPEYHCVHPLAIHVPPKFLRKYVTGSKNK